MSGDMRYWTTYWLNGSNPYKEEAWIVVGTYEGDQQVSTSWLGEPGELAQECYLDIKRFGNVRYGVNMSRNEFNENALI